MDRLILKIKSFVNNILIKTKSFKKPIAFTLSACCIVVAVILCSFFVRNNAKDNNEEKEVLMGAEQTAPSPEPISESTTEPTEPETEPTEALTEPTEIQTEPETEVLTEPEPEPEIEFTITARDAALEGEPVEFDFVLDGFQQLLYKEINSSSLIAPIKNGSEYDYQRIFTIFTARSLEEFESNFISLIRTDVIDHSHHECLEKYDKSYFEKKAVFILINGYRVHEVIKDGAELCICASTLLSTPKESGYCTDTMVRPTSVRFIEINKDDLDGIDTVSFFIEGVESYDDAQ